MKFVHLADVHLGAIPDKGYPWSEKRSKELWEGFQKVIGEVGELKADLLLIAGDLFHRQPLMRELKEVNYLFSTIPNTKIVLIAGNHDYIKRDSYYLSFPWCKNVFFLQEERCQEVYFEECNTYVHGLSYHSQEIREARYDQMRVEKEEAIHILLAHGGDEKHIPIHKELVAMSGFDYIALGHIHKPQMILPRKMAYAGALEPLDRNDTGRHGYFIGECDATGVTLVFCPSAKRSYIPLVIEMNPQMSQFALEQEIRKEIEEHGRENIYQIFLEGYRDAQMLVDMASLQKLGNVVEVLDDTQADYDFGEIYKQHEGSLIGEYVAHFLEKDRTIIENKALYYGLRALMDTKELGTE